MRGWNLRLLMCLMVLAPGVAGASSQMELSVIEWDIPGIPEPIGAAVVYQMDGREIKARPGERVYISTGERLEARSMPQEIQASAPSSPAPRGKAAYPKTKVTIPGFVPTGVLRDSVPQAAVSVESDRAYAALGNGRADAPRHLDEGGVRIPRAFTFEPDYSPVLIQGVTSPGGQGRAMPVRNANVYRRYGGGRRAAEIIEKDPVDPVPYPDNSIMAPPGGGRVYRAEVVLPSSARGIGMGSEYASGR